MTLSVTAYVILTLFLSVALIPSLGARPPERGVR